MNGIVHGHEYGVTCYLHLLQIMHHLPKTTKVKKVLMKTLWYHYALVSLCKIQDCLMQSRAAGTSKAAKKGEMVSREISKFF